MCGITGKIFFTADRVHPSDIEALTHALAHRGPDDTGTYISPYATVGLGHRRLSVIDLTSAGRQPMRYLNRYVITFNGEIYNFQALREDLKQRGYHFRSATDTEVILGLYDAHGERCVDYLNGMFAFAIYDEQEHKLFCARDRLGKKPFKYYADHKVFIFASEIKAILTQPEVSAAPDLAALNHYLTFQYVPTPQTGFTNIYKLPPAHTLSLNVTNGQLSIRKYWTPDSTGPQPIQTAAEWEQLLRSAVAQAVRDRLIADVPLGAFLSGGLDSSAVVALMAQASPRRIKTFSIGFNSSAHDELAYSRLVARRYNTDHTELRVTPDPLDIVNILRTHLDEPFADSSAIPTYYLCQLTRQHVTVALTGDGGDELFAGYRHYLAHRLAHYISRVPGSGRIGTALAGHLSPRPQKFAASLAQEVPRRHLTYIAYADQGMKRYLYSESLSTFLNDTPPHLPGSTGDPVAIAQNFDLQTYLPDDILAKVDYMSMAVGLEARCPLLDYHIVALATRIPTNLKLRGWQSKYIWKRALRDIVPESILARSKQGFTVPLSNWLQGPLRTLLYDTLTSARSRQRGLFNTPHLEKLMSVHDQGGNHLARPLWALLALELWFQTYIDRP